MRRIVLIVLLGCAGAVAVTLFVVRASGEETDQAPAVIDLERCRNLLPDASRDCWTQRVRSGRRGSR